MKTTRVNLINHRRIGRKVLQADRLARALNPAEYKQARRAWYVPFVRPKVIAIACVVIVGVSTLGFGGSQFYFAQAAATQKAAAADQESKLKDKSAAASACRREKAEQKADQLGKVTFDELYDYDECDK